MINWNRTSCRPIRSVIILESSELKEVSRPGRRLVMKEIGLPLHGRPILLITCVITDRIGLHSVLLPLHTCLIFSLSSRRLEVTRCKERSVRERCATEEGPTSLVCVPRTPRSFLRPPLPWCRILLNYPTHSLKMVGELFAKWGI